MKKPAKALIIFIIAAIIGSIGCGEKATPEVKEQIDRLSSSDPEERTSAVFELGRMRTIASAAMPDLIKALKDKDRRVRWSAAIVLGNMEDKRAVKPLIKALKDERWEVRLRAAESLGNLRYKKAVKPLIKTLKDERLVVKAKAAEALGNIKDTRAVSPLIDLLSEKEEAIKDKAVKALIKITGEDLGDEREKWIEWWKENKDKFD
jgi:HEAT repeat protein